MPSSFRRMFTEHRRTTILFDFPGIWAGKEKGAARMMRAAPDLQ
jgi:hypothetical protein